MKNPLAEFHDPKKPERFTNEEIQNALVEIKQREMDRNKEILNRIRASNKVSANAVELKALDQPASREPKC